MTVRIGRVLVATAIWVLAAAPVFKYSTYLGGSADDAALGVAVDASGCAYVTGLAASTNFPTAGPYQGSLAGGSDAFVAKLSSGGSTLVYSTFLGGSLNDIGAAVAVDGEGHAFVTGYASSTDFPVVGAYQAENAGGQYDVFVAKLDPSGSALAWSSLPRAAPGTIRGRAWRSIRRGRRMSPASPRRQTSH